MRISDWSSDVCSSDLTAGWKFQLPVPLSKRPDNDGLRVPIAPVRDIDGKKAARAAPILALDAIRACSAWRISGLPNRTRESRSAGRAWSVRGKIGRASGRERVGQEV